jgi:hypothetical protein
MQITDLVGCCNAHVVWDFGGTVWSAGKVDEITEDELTVEVQQIILREGHYKILIATTNNQQKEANAVLRKLGFSHSRWISKYQHPGTRIRIWWREPTEQP